jgi:LuxR family quorum-sensing system transcriptional regulator CciR
MKPGFPAGAMANNDAFEFTTALRRLRSLPECEALFAAAILPFGFDTFATGEVDLVDRERTVFHLIHWPERWRQFYFASGLVERDPIVNELATRREPFTWSDLRKDRKLKQVGRDALDHAQAAGWSEGLVVPIGQAGNRIGLVSMVGSCDGLDPAPRAFLIMISYSLHAHVRTMTAKEGFAAPPAGLTEREIAAMRLVAEGRSDTGIAAAMGVAPSTAHEFVEKAKRRLNAGSRAELAAIGVAMGIIEV